MLAAFATIASFGALAFAADGSALLAGTRVTLTATGPSPSAVKMTAGQSELFFVNDDSVTHRVVFADGRCTLDVAPGDDSGDIQSSVNACPSLYAGSYAYSVDGRFPGSVHVVAAPRSVTLTARTHTLARGESLVLHGEVTFAQGSEPTLRPPFPVLVLARGDHHFRRVAILGASVRDGEYVWHLRVRPGVRTTYIAEVVAQRRVWKEARSASFTIRIRR